MKPLPELVSILAPAPHLHAARRINSPEIVTLPAVVAYTRRIGQTLSKNVCKDTVKVTDYPKIL